jgi:hypothetical protein
MENVFFMQCDIKIPKNDWYNTENDNIRDVM